MLTLDLDFSDVFRFPPHETGGIVIFRTARNHTYGLIINLIKQFMNALDKENLEGKLWIVEQGRIRIHQEK